MPALRMNSAHSKSIDFFFHAVFYPAPTNVSGYFFTDFCRIWEQVLISLILL